MKSNSLFLYIFVMSPYCNITMINLLLVNHIKKRIKKENRLNIWGLIMVLY